MPKDRIQNLIAKIKGRAGRPGDSSHDQTSMNWQPVPVPTTDPMPTTGPAPLVLLAGPPRSGTTWLNREICDRPGWAGFLPECTMLTQQIALYSQTRHYGEPKRFAAYFGNNDNLAAIYRSITSQMVDLAGRLSGKSAADVLVLKDPELSLYLQDLAEILPPHQLICIVRDPRDVIASVRKVSDRKQEKWDVAKACTWIFPYFANIQKHRKKGGAKTLFVRYEDLVGGQIDKVRTFLGQPDRIDPAAADPKAIAARLDPSDPFFSALYLQPTTQDMVGSYAKTLTRADIDHVQNVFSGVMAAWGYR